MKHKFYFLFTFIISIFMNANAQQVAFTEAGDKIILYNNGTWQKAVSSNIKTYSSNNNNNNSTYINLSGKGLTSVPSWVFNDKVEVLDLSNNNLKEISSSIQYCTNLRELNISSNNISQITSYIQYCKNL